MARKIRRLQRMNNIISKEWDSYSAYDKKALEMAYRKKGLQQESSPILLSRAQLIF